MMAESAVSCAGQILNSVKFPVDHHPVLALEILWMIAGNRELELLQFDRGNCLVDQAERDGDARFVNLAALFFCAGVGIAIVGGPLAD